MAHIEFQIPRATDQKLLQSLKSVYDQFQREPTSTQINYFDGASNINLAQFESDVQLKQILDLESEIIISLTVTVQNHHSLTVSRVPNLLHDKVSLSPYNNQPPVAPVDRIEIARVLSFAKKELQAFSPERTMARLISDETKHYYDIRESELIKLKDITEKLIKDNVAYRNQVDAEYQGRIEDLNKKFEDKEKLLDNKFSEKNNELEQKKKELEEIKNQFDDRESKHVRRKLRDDLKEELKKRGTKFELTAGTRKLRQTTFWFSIILLTIFGVCTAAYFVEGIMLFKKSPELLQNTSFVVITGLRQMLLAAAFGATAIFFIRWTNQWFQQHANEEFRLKRLDLDIDRASWVAEFAFEWKEQKGTEIPEELLDRLSRNLFVDNSTPSDQLHPADQLASAILGTASSLELSVPGGGKIAIDRKGLQKLKKARDDQVQ